MRQYEASTLIAAPPERIWGVLADAGSYPSWDSGVERVTGAVAPGAKLTVVSSASPGRSFPVKVTELDAPRRMTWAGGMPLGLFRGVRTFTLTPEDDGTRFVMREQYSGPLLGLIWRSMPDLRPSFDTFASGLKARVEAVGR